MCLSLYFINFFLDEESDDGGNNEHGRDGDGAGRADDAHGAFADGVAGVSGAVDDGLGGGASAGADGVRVEGVLAGGTVALGELEGGAALVGEGGVPVVDAGGRVAEEPEGGVSTTAVAVAVVEADVVSIGALDGEGGKDDGDEGEHGNGERAHL